jgi:hypothetical protein
MFSEKYLLGIILFYHKKAKIPSEADPRGFSNVRENGGSQPNTTIIIT